MEAVFQAPKRRTRVYEPYEAPLPVPFGQDGTYRHDLVLKAELHNNHVIVRNPDHIQTLYNKGYFGKGILSRSRPEHSISLRWASHGGTCFPVISHTRYQAQLDLAKDALQAQGIDDEVIRRIITRLSQPLDLLKADSCKDQENGHGTPPTTGALCPPVEVGASPPPSAPSCHDTAVNGIEEDAEEEEGVQPKAKRSRRQGNLAYDPLASLYPEEPERLDPDVLAQVKCLKHDDWLLHCGCRLQDSQVTLKKDNDQVDTLTMTTDDIQGYEYVLVEEEEEEEESAREGSTPDLEQGNAKKNSTKEIVCRINPFRITEYLQLALEEAFFLLYALGCLLIYDREEALSIPQVWRMFCGIQPNFETTYAAYHYFRSKGWVPKTGVKYGSDFMLYRKGPPFYHASYSVVVERVNETFQGATLRPFSWRSLATLSRITGNVSKELMLCYVIIPSNLTEETLRSPDCIEEIKVQEIILSRWISSRERTDQDDI